MNVLILFTIYCRHCNHANTWNIAKAPSRVNLTRNVGYSVCCEACGGTNEYQINEITTNQIEG